MILYNPRTFLKNVILFLGLCWLIPSSILHAQTTDTLTQPETASGSYVSDFQDTTYALASPNPVIEGVLTQPEKCNQHNGSLEVISSGGKGSLQYSLDGSSFQSSNTFNGLQAGWYTIYVMDETANTTLSTSLVESTKSMSLDWISSTSAECVDQNGAVLLDVSGGTEPYFYSLNNGPAALEPLFTQLPPGTYSIHIEDAQGCSIDTTVSIEHLPCPLYIPNVFSPNNDGVNDLFQIRVNDDQQITITRFFIFDRFGKKVYERFELPAQSNVGWWDGNFKHFTSPAGAYYYFLEVEFENGDKETFKGDLTLIR